jgi:hypothetical protein
MKCYRTLKDQLHSDKAGFLYQQSDSFQTPKSIQRYFNWRFQLDRPLLILLPGQVGSYGCGFMMIYL